MMEFLTGVKEQETLELTTLLTGDYEGQSVKLNGAIHTIRDMGEVAFVILRKREGLIQCVFEEGVTKFELKDLKEAATVEVEGVVAKEDRAPNGIECSNAACNIKMETEYILRGKAKQPCRIS